MRFLERIDQIKSLLSLTDSAIESKAGLSNGSLRKSANPGFDKIESILKAFPVINAEWLLMGTGNPLKTYQSNESNDTASMVEENNKTSFKQEDKTLLESKEIVIRILTEKIKVLEDEAETLRQQKYNYRKTPSMKQQNELHNKGAPFTHKQQRFSPK
jgi:hypothetical protein